jgi:hypothetical protein
MGAVSGWDARERHARKITKEFLDVMQEAEEEQEEQIHIIIEKHNDMLYVYDKDTKQFMAQGSSKEDVEKVLVERFPGKRFACPESILKEVGFLS